ncbi:MAG: hypothetical protein JWL91_1728 [Sphingomonas bacterium]|nr:hypothetical protein [Sphingomonas bacterium]MDB5689852.1 hypothetical protein [Sphingomonas bacterium]
MTAAMFSARGAARRGVGGRWTIAALLVVLPIAIIAALSWTLRAPAADRLDERGRTFVGLALQMGRIDPEEVDGYSGPPELRPAATDPVPSLAALRRDLASLATQLAEEDSTSRRATRLSGRIANLIALIDVKSAPHPLPFDEEARRLYGIDAAAADGLAKRQAIARLETLLPGPGSLAVRVAAFRDHYAVPEAVREAMFARTLAECRRRTLAHWPMPAAERLAIVWTSDVQSAWHRYDGGFRSTLRINPRAVGFVGSMIDLACHEGYPGHHAQFVLQDQAAGAGGLPIEERVVLLRSADSMFREGAASYGVDLAFPAADRIAFERDVLFPLAGFPPAEAARFAEVRALIDALSAATVPILRDYRDGRIDGEAAVAALDRDALVSSPRPLLGFVDALGPYVLGYTVARDWVRTSVERRAAGGDRWALLGRAVTHVALPPPASVSPVKPSRTGFLS